MPCWKSLDSVARFNRLDVTGKMDQAHHLKGVGFHLLNVRLIGGYLVGGSDSFFWNLFHVWVSFLKRHIHKRDASFSLSTVVSPVSKGSLRTLLLHPGFSSL